MLDIKFILENKELVKQNCINRLSKANIDLLCSKYEEKLSILQRLESLQAERNRNSKTKPTPEIIEQIKKINSEIEDLQPKLNIIETEVRELLLQVPNMTHKDVHVSLDEDENPVLEVVGSPKEFGFTPKDHVELSESLDLIDFDRGTKVAGAKFYYLKNELALMEFALTQYALEVCVNKGFIPFTTPDLARKDVLEGLGFQPRGESTQIYSIENSDLCLVATAEITMGGYHADEVLDLSKLPLKYAAVSHCFRTEAGAASKFSKGIFRVHQFSKIEMFAYTTPEQSEGVHKELLEIEKEIFKGLNVPFRVIDHCTADLGGPSIRTYDLEAWMPGKPKSDGTMGNWGEITSTSNCTDFQSRGLNIKYKKEDGTKEFVHTLNGTAISMARALISIMENNQTEDGEIIIPEVLRKYLNGREKISKK